MNKKHKIFNQKSEPAIYIRMFSGVIMYIGETKDWRRGRPFRDSDDPKMVNAQFISKFIDKNPDKDWDWNEDLLSDYVMCNINLENWKKVEEDYYSNL